MRLQAVSQLVDDAMRKDRQQKLANVLRNNSTLTGSSPCSSTEAEAVAVGMEGALYQPGMNAEEYQGKFRSAVQQLKAASSWAGLPGVGGMQQGKGLEIVLQKAVAGCEGAAAVAAVGEGSGSNAMAVAAGEGSGEGAAAAGAGAPAGKSEVGEAAVAQLRLLAKLPVTAAVLEATAAGKRIKALKKHCVPGVAAAADQVVKAWRQRILTAAAGK